MANPSNGAEGETAEDVELISSTVGKLISYLNDYVSGTKAGEEFEFLEKQLFFCMSVLRTYDVLKTNINESRIEVVCKGWNQRQTRLVCSSLRS